MDTIRSKMRGVFKKSSNDYKADGKKKKPRDKTLRHSRSMPHQMRTFADTDPEVYVRTGRPIYRGLEPLKDAKIELVMDISKNRAKAPYRSSPYQDDTDEELDFNRTPPPTPPPKPTPKEVRKALLDKFPTPPTEMPIPRMNDPVPAARPRPGGKLVVERRYRAAVYKLDTQQPGSGPYPHLFDTLPIPTTAAVPAAELLPPPMNARHRIREIREEFQQKHREHVEKEAAREEAEEARKRHLAVMRKELEMDPTYRPTEKGVEHRRQPLQRSFSTNASSSGNIPDEYIDAVKPRPWAHPTVFHNENHPRTGPTHHRLISNPIPLGSNMRPSNGDNVAYFRDGPVARHPVVQSGLPEIRPLEIRRRKESNNSTHTPADPSRTFPRGITRIRLYSESTHPLSRPTDGYHISPDPFRR